MNDVSWWSSTDVPLSRFSVSLRLCHLSPSGLHTVRFQRRKTMKCKQWERLSEACATADVRVGVSLAACPMYVCMNVCVCVAPRRRESTQYATRQRAPNSIQLPLGPTVQVHRVDALRSLSNVEWRSCKIYFVYFTCRFNRAIAQTSSTGVKRQ